MQTVLRSVVLGCMMMGSAMACPPGISAEEAEQLSLNAQIVQISPPAVSPTQAELKDSNVAWTYYTVGQADVKKILGPQYKQRLKDDTRFSLFKAEGWKRGYQWGKDGQLMLLPDALNALHTPISH